jgi:hypothetical protein
VQRLGFRQDPLQAQALRRLGTTTRSQPMPTSQSGPPDDPSFAWFHAIITTYGAWLDGDARGFRTRHHREHVEGDYKNPPPKE